MATTTQTTTAPSANVEADNRPSNAWTSASEQASAAPRDTGFSEPLSTQTNTTLPHKDALTGPGEELDVGVIAENKHRRRIPGRRNHVNVDKIEAEMYKDLEVVDADDYEKTQSEGKFKKILHKLPCTH